jgi:hypothetical protein
MKIICFSSHTAIWYFALAEAAIANALQKKGHEVVFITPGDQLVGISNRSNEKILRREFDLDGYEIGEILTPNDYRKVNLILSKLNKNNFEKLKINGIYIGKIALYEYLLNHKKNSARINDYEWKECLMKIKNTLISLFAAKLIINREKPDRILMYNTLYSVNHVWEKFANFKMIPVYFLHHGLNLSDMDNTLIIAKGNTYRYFDLLKKNWPKLKNIPVSENMLDYVTDNFMELLKAKHYLIYSAPKSNKVVSIRKIFNINEKQKILTATMSSYDEMFAAEYVGVRNLPENLIFSTQTDWIDKLISYAKNRNDLFLLIRVHPREFPNKREGVKSEHAKMLEKVFKNLPANVKINWPTDKISIYDLAQETDVFLNAWSTVGVEMSLLGIPVVLYSKDLILYPPDLNYVGINRKDYFAKIELALKDGWSPEKIKMTYRWLALFYNHTIMRLRKKQIQHKQSRIDEMTSGIAHYFYGFISSKLGSIFAKVPLIIYGLSAGKRQTDNCRRQLAENIDISGVEKMLCGSTNTLVNMHEVKSKDVTTEEEDIYIRKEVKRIYKALYLQSPKGSKINVNSLQYKLRQVFILKSNNFYGK